MRLSRNAALLLALHPCIGACTRPGPLLTCQSTRPAVPAPLHGSLLCCPCPFVVPGPPPHLPLTALRPSALPSLSGLLLCCRPCPGSLTSWRRPVRWARGAALQPPLEASPTSSPSGWPEHDSEAVLGGCHKLWGGRGCSLTGLVSGHSESDPRSQLQVSRRPHFSTKGLCVLSRPAAVSCGR